MIGKQAFRSRFHNRLNPGSGPLPTPRWKLQDRKVIEIGFSPFLSPSTPFARVWLYGNADLLLNWPLEAKTEYNFSQVVHYHVSYELWTPHFEQKKRKKSRCREFANNNKVNLSADLITLRPVKPNWGNIRQGTRNLAQRTTVIAVFMEFKSNWITRCERVILQNRTLEICFRLNHKKGKPGLVQKLRMSREEMFTKWNNLLLSQKDNKLPYTKLQI